MEVRHFLLASVTKITLFPVYSPFDFRLVVVCWEIHGILKKEAKQSLYTLLRRFWDRLLAQFAGPGKYHIIAPFDRDLI